MGESYTSLSSDWQYFGRHSVIINPFTPMRDQDRISPYGINTISSRLVMRIKKNIS